MSAEHKQRRMPGSQLLRIAADYFDQSTSEMMLKPIIADKHAVALAALWGVVLGAIVAAYGSKVSLGLFMRKHTESTGNQ